jgi:peptide/nickel transport system substrate-binding protein
MKRRFALLVSILLLAAMIGQAVLSAAPQGAAAKEDGTTTETATLPHPLLSQYNIRKAIALCTDKETLFAAAYPDVPAAERAAYITDSFFPNDHWAYTAPTTTYAYDPTQGIALLESEGWLLAPGMTFRTKGYQELVFTMSSTDMERRLIYLKVFEEQMADCGIRVVRDHQPSWEFFSNEGLWHRNFELSAYAWMSFPDDPDEKAGIYGCEAIPYPENGWLGVNFPGWCNPVASAALTAGDDTTLSEAERIANYAIAQEAFAADLPVLPLFQRVDSLPNISMEHIDFNLDALFTLTNPRSHPILAAQDMRKAIAYCTNKDALLAAAYPELTFDERQAVLMDSFFTKDHWAYTPPAPEDEITYNPAQGMTLLEGLGWTLPSGGTVRERDGKELTLTYKSTDAEIRLAYMPVFEQQMAACGIRVILEPISSVILFGSETGLARRDFELASFGWVIGDDTASGEAGLYGCNAIPLPHNNWEAGQNFMGWCNPTASAALEEAVDTTLPENERIALFAIAQEAFYQDVPVLPLFLRPGSTVWEHLDFNFDTFVQVLEVPVDEASSLTFTNFDSRGDIQIPAEAVSEPVDLLLQPLGGTTQPLPDDTLPAFGFTLTAAINGVEQRISPS